MSAKKKDSNTERKSEQERAVDPQVLAGLARKMRNLLRYHQNLGITSYPLTPELSRFLTRKKDNGEVLAPRRPEKKKTEKPPLSPSPPDAAVRNVLQELEQEVRECALSPLVRNRQGVVGGRGSDHPALMVVGNWSYQESGFAGDVVFGSREDAMLEKMMAAIGLDSHTVYVTNAVKCCPTADRMPDQAEEQACFSYLSREIAVIRPRLICAMGETAVRLLLDRSDPLVRLRGKFYPYRYGDGDDQDALVMPTFHPRFLLVNSELKKATWHDLQMIQRRLAG